MFKGLEPGSPIGVVIHRCVCADQGKIFLLSHVLFCKVAMLLDIPGPEKMHWVGHAVILVLQQGTSLVLGATRKGIGGESTALSEDTDKELPVHDGLGSSIPPVRR